MSLGPRASRGQAFPMVVFSILVLMGCVGLAVDVGYWRYQRGLEQTAADSAALAGAVQLSYSPSLSLIVAAAQADAKINGFDDADAAVVVTVNQPPLSGAYAGNVSAVEVIVAKAQPARLALVFGKSATTVSARAVAILSQASRNCVVALGNSSQAIDLNGGTITMPTCGMISNGGLLLNQGTVKAASIGYAAGASLTDSATTFPNASPQVAINAVDPCGAIPGCAYLTANPPTSGSCASQTTFQANPTNITPGKYCSQVMFNGGGAVNFAAGIYDFQNGMTVNSATALNGAGVTFYIQGGNFIINQGPTVNLSAPSTGNTAGVLIYQPSNNSGQFTVNSGSSQTTGGWAGMVYIPSGQLMLNGTMLTWLMVVANSITFNSGSGVNVTDSSFPGYGHAVLAE